MTADMDTEWSATSPAEVGFATDLDERFEICRQAGVLPNLHGVVVARSGRIFFERYFAGPDAARARPLGVVRFAPDTLHDLRSVSKSIVGLLYGIAMAAGHVPPPEATLIELFPEYPDLATDPARQQLTVRHALTMTLGTEWDELTIPYTDPRNSEIAMDRATDRYRYILERPIVGPPGGVGRTTAVQLPSWRASSPKELAGPCTTLRVKRCSTRWGSAAPNGSAVRMARRSPPRGCACRRAIWRGSAPWCWEMDAGKRDKWCRRSGLWRPSRPP